VPKCEIFDPSDFYDFYIIKLSGLVTLGLKYELVTLIFWGIRHHLISDAFAECSHQFLMLSARISSIIPF
jgi:hypothetical protein